MNINLDELRSKLEQTISDYKEKFDKRSDKKTYERLRDGIEAIGEANEIVGKVASSVHRGNMAVQGSMAHMRRKIGKSNAEDKNTLTLLREEYTGGANNGYVKRALGVVPLVKRFIPNREITLEQTLEIIADVAEEIPEYVSTLSNHLSNKRAGLNEFRTEMRYSIEELITDKYSLEQELPVLETQISEMKSRYKELEQIRSDNSKQRIQTESSLLEEIAQLELGVGEIEEKYTELKGYQAHIESHIDIVNNQIGKVGQLLELLQESQKTVGEASNFVNVQVPYIVHEIQTQGAQIHALSGVDRALEFMQKQGDVSKEINTRIKIGAERLGVVVSEVIRDFSEDKSIYAEDKKKIGGRPKVAGYLTKARS